LRADERLVRAERLGFYPVDPVSGIYVFGSPLFDRVEVKLGDKGARLVVEAQGNAPDAPYIQSVEWRGQPWTRAGSAMRNCARAGVWCSAWATPNKGFASAARTAPILRSQPGVKVTRQAMMMTGAALAFGPGAVPAVAHDLGRACLSSDEAGTVAARVLGERLAERVGHALPTQHCDSRMIVALDEQVQKLLPAGVTVPPTPAAQGEGFSIRMLGSRAHPVLVLSAAQKRGLVYAAGWLLRSADARGRLSARPSFSTTPRYSVRMTQIGYRAKNNTYDAWDLKRFRRRIEDFALWGSSGVQVIPLSDDAPSSPLFPAPPLETLAGIGTIAHELGIDFALYYPNLGDYAAPPARQAEADRLSALLKQLPKVDALYIPGGDPGHTPPDHLIPLVEREAAALHAINPAARSGFPRKASMPGTAPPSIRPSPSTRRA
jgi:hypothetical protein